MKKIFLTLLSLSIIFSLFVNVSGAECSLFNSTDEITCNSYDGCSYAGVKNCNDFENNEAGCNFFISCGWQPDRFSCSEFDNEEVGCNTQSPCIWHGDAPLPQYCEGEYPCENYGVDDCELNGCTWHPEEPVPTGWCEGGYHIVGECDGEYWNGTCAGTFFAGIFASIDYPFNQTYSENITTLNYTITNATSCFYSFNETNYSLSCNETYLLLNSLYESNTWTIYADNISDSVTFFVNVPQEAPQEESIIYNLMNSSGAGLGILMIILATALPVLLIGFAMFYLFKSFGDLLVSSVSKTPIRFTR